MQKITKRLEEIFPEQVLKDAKKYKDADARTICSELIIPNLTEINKKSGQENNPQYLAYAIQYALLQMNTKLKKKHDSDDGVNYET